MLVFKRKQIVVLSLVLMIVIAGYLQYSYKKSSVSVSSKDNGRLGEAVYVENNDEKPQVNDTKKDKKENKTNQSSKASKEANDFFALAKLNKEVTRSKDADALKSVTEDSKAAKEVRAKAYEQMMKIVGIAEKEMKIETLVKEKGFSDVVALFGDDGSLDIVVKSPSLTSSETAQIADVACRHANVQMTDIHVKNIY